jgi:hypothetical protein
VRDIGERFETCLSAPVSSLVRLITIRTGVSIAAQYSCTHPHGINSALEDKLNKPVMLLNKTSEKIARFASPSQSIMSRLTVEE